MVAVRLFAAAAEAAGVDETVVQGSTVGAVRSALGERFGDDCARVIAQCALVVDGRRASDDDALAASARVDVLPPFAGG